jgi:hypothetical protein
LDAIVSNWRNKVKTLNNSSKFSLSTTSVLYVYDLRGILTLHLKIEISIKYQNTYKINFKWTI